MPNIIIFIVVIIVILNVIAQTGKQPQPEPQRKQPQPNRTGEQLAQLELLDAIYAHVNSLEDERNRLDRECEKSIDRKNSKRFEANAKKIDRLTEQIARKKVQIAKLESKLNH